MVRRTWSLVVPQLFRAIIAFLERTLICGLSLRVYCCLPTLRLRRGFRNLDLGVSSWTNLILAKMFAVIARC